MSTLMKFRWVIAFVLAVALCVAAVNIAEHPSTSPSDVIMSGLVGAGYAIAYLGLTFAVLAPLVWLLRKRAKERDKKD